MNYSNARQIYADFGVDTEKALETLTKVSISIHCWQGDDVAGFEPSGIALSGGIQATGNYPGKARNLEELRADLERALTLIPGTHRINLHAIYGDFNGKKIERDEITIEQFQSWVDWAKEWRLGIDFNPSFFSHEKSKDGFTLSHQDKAVREFWIRHGVASRRIAEGIGHQLGSPVVTNFWVPDGFKDLPVDRRAPRERLASSLDEIFAEGMDPAYNLDAVESKLFGIGSESYVVGSHEFYLGYAISRQKLLCLDAGHFHPTETLADKISSVLQFVPEILLHVSRGVRWDSDHVVILDDATKSVMEEVIRTGHLSRTHIGLDFFDASINRISAWVIGTRSTLKALLIALLEPIDSLRQAESKGDFSKRLAVLEELKMLPFGAIWDEYCLRQSVPTGIKWMDEVEIYESTVLGLR